MIHLTRSQIRRSAFGALLCFLALSAFALDVPPKPVAWVTDRASLLSADQQQSLNQKLEAFHQRSGAQFLVFIFPSLEGEQLENYTMRVADQWKVKGDAALIFFVFVKEHAPRIEVGYGLEGKITDALSSEILRNTVTPAFRAGDFHGGINAALDRLMAAVEGKAPPPESMPARPPQGQPQPLRASDILFLIIVVLVFLFVIVPLMRRGGCGGCIGCLPLFPFGGGGGGWSGGGSSGGGWNVGGSWGGGGSSFGGGGASGGW
jgi:uncharacterized protein